MQVADRWHLWDNLCRHVERLVAAHHACLPEPATPAADHPADEPADLSVLQWPDTVRVTNTRRRYQQIRVMRDQGLSMRAKLLSSNDIDDWARAEATPSMCCEN